MFNSKKWRKRNSIDIIFLWRFLQVRITSEEASLFIFFYIKSKPEFSNPANAALSKQPNRLRLKRYSWNNGSYNSTDRGALLVTSGLSIPRSTAVSWTARFTRTRNVYGRRTCRALLIHTISYKNFRNDSVSQQADIEQIGLWNVRITASRGATHLDLVKSLGGARLPVSAQLAQEPKTSVLCGLNEPR